MSLLDEIRAKMAMGAYELSKHAVDQTILRRISIGDVRRVIAFGEIIEDYPEDKYGPSCLIFGRTAAARPLHVQCSYPSRTVIKIITIYEPEPARWIDFKLRRTR